MWIEITQPGENVGEWFNQHLGDEFNVEAAVVDLALHRMAFHVWVPDTSGVLVLRNVDAMFCRVLNWSGFPGADEADDMRRKLYALRQTIDGLRKQNADMAQELIELKHPSNSVGNPTELDGEGGPA